MTTIIPPDRHDQTLIDWRGSTAKIWLYHVSLKRLVIQVYRSSLKETLYVLAMGCTRITGPFSWSPSELIIQRVSHMDGTAEVVIADPKAGFQLNCASVTLSLGPQEVPPEPLVHFFNDDD